MADKRSEATGGHRRSDDGRGLDKPPAVGDTDSGPDSTRQGDKVVDLLIAEIMGIRYTYWDSESV